MSSSSGWFSSCRPSRWMVSDRVCTEISSVLSPEAPVLTMCATLEALAPGSKEPRDTPLMSPEDCSSSIAIVLTENSRERIVPLK